MPLIHEDNQQIEDKLQGIEGKLLEPPKTHAIGEFVVVVKNGGHTMCR